MERYIIFRKNGELDAAVSYKLDPAAHEVAGCAPEEIVEVINILDPLGYDNLFRQRILPRFSEKIAAELIDSLEKNRNRT